jgi:hypothetical protein
MMNNMTALEQYIYDAMDMQYDAVQEQLELYTRIEMYVL